MNGFYGSLPDGDPLAICQVYLDQGAWTFFGMLRNSAYGPTDDKISPTWICANFLKAVLDGGSTGRAVCRASRSTSATAAIWEWSI